MPELDIERRPAAAMPWWVWLLIAALVICLTWWLTTRVTPGRDRAESIPGAAPAEQVAGERMQTPPAGADLTSAEWLPLAAMRANPDNYFGRPISGTGTVAELIGDRGFWIEQRGARVFVVKDEALLTAPAIATGQEISLKGTAHNPDQMQEVPGVMQLDEATLKMLQGEPAFIKATEIVVRNENR